jgi:hypothetical protein
MYIVQDKHKNQVALLHNNILVAIHDESVLGVILGHCVFSKNEKLIGRIFSDKIFLQNGKLIGTIVNIPANHQFDEIKTLQDAWMILSKIKEHNCSWIKDSQVWDLSEFLEHF